MQKLKIKIESKNLKIKDEVYMVVKKIPRGKVMTYSQIANAIWKSQITNHKLQNKINPRYIGYILHNNPDPKHIPCHRVVNSKGKLAKNYAFGGMRKQREKLIAEGVVFKKINYVSPNSFFT